MNFNACTYVHASVILRQLTVNQIQPDEYTHVIRLHLSIRTKVRSRVRVSNLQPLQQPPRRYKHTRNFSSNRVLCNKGTPHLKHCLSDCFASPFDLPRPLYVCHSEVSEDDMNALNMLLTSNRRPLLPRFISLPARAPSSTISIGHTLPGTHTGQSAVESTLWPGPDLKISKFLPGSVYLWACGERGEGDGTSPVSRSETCAAWVVLTVSAELVSFEALICAVHPL